MQGNRQFSGSLLLRALAMVFFVACGIAAQTTTSAIPSGRPVYFDSNGKRITQEEFVEIRTANPNVPDATIIRAGEDGTVEFRLQKIPQEGMPLPEFSVRTIDGMNISTSDLKGKVVVLNFWFIGCPACMSEMPSLNLLAAKFAGKEDVVFLSMTEDKLAAVKRFVERERFDYTHAAEAGSAMKLFGFVGYPKNIVVSKTGEVVYWRTGIKAWNKFESVIRAELEK
ncbi:MAG: TlpA disulfide reductase family protein [Pyrinomonadaceae bacterium]|nr:TlpA disulfide reductase family protein [Pyrinomonadaceae bacterium]